MHDQFSQECGFCGKRRGQVEHLVAGPKVSICNECIVVLADILQKERHRRSTAAPSRPVSSERPEEGGINQ